MICENKEEILHEMRILISEYVGFACNFGVLSCVSRRFKREEASSVADRYLVDRHPRDWARFAGVNFRSLSFQGVYVAPGFANFELVRMQHLALAQESARLIKRVDRAALKTLSVALERHYNVKLFQHFPVASLDLSKCPTLSDEETKFIPRGSLRSLDLSGCSLVASLRFISGSKLARLNLKGCLGISSLEPLRGLPLDTLDLSDCAGLDDLRPLEGLPLETLNLSGCVLLTSLWVLRTLPLRALSLAGCVQLTDLAPLRRTRLRALNLAGCSQLTNLEPLANLPLEFLNLRKCRAATDLSPLKNLILKHLRVICPREKDEPCALSASWTRRGAPHPCRVHSGARIAIDALCSQIGARHAAAAPPLLARRAHSP